MLMTLLFDDRPVQVFQQESLAAALRRSGVEIATGCNGQNKCGSCRIRLLAGTFFSNGKVFEVTDPVDLNACSLRQLSSSAKACSINNISRASQMLLTDLRPQPTDQVILGIDLGTTNIGFALQKEGKVFTGTLVNAQVRYGDNVIDRIAFAARDTGREQLRRALFEETLLPFLQALPEAQKISAAAVTGNTAMTHFFFDEDPAPLGHAPFVPEKTAFHGTAADLGLVPLQPRTPVYAADCLCHFIGGDISAGLAVTGFGSKDKCELYMDFGTNCEMVLNDHGCCYALSAAAGPAFERFNLRADQKDTVRHLTFVNGSWHCTPAVDTPAGFCGTGLADLLAEGFRHGFLDRFGRWQKEPHLPEKLTVSNALLAELMTARAAIAACLELLFQKVNLSPENLDQVFLAGNFAENLDLNNAKFLGLLPDLPDDRFRQCGNAALRGALMLAGSPQKTAEFKNRLHGINPAEEPAYQQIFTRALSLDHH